MQLNVGISIILLISLFLSPFIPIYFSVGYIKSQKITCAIFLQNFDQNF